MVQSMFSIDGFYDEAKKVLHAAITSLRKSPSLENKLIKVFWHAQLSEPKYILAIHDNIIIYTTCIALVLNLAYFSSWWISSLIIKIKSARQFDPCVNQIML